MIDESGTFSGGAAKEIAEETGLKVSGDELIDLTQMGLRTGDMNDLDEEHLQAGVYPSPGGCDEFIPIFLWQKRIPRNQMQKWRGKLTGLRDEGEKITLTLCPLDQLWRRAGRDAKSLAAWALYHGLRSEGRI